MAIMGLHIDLREEHPRVAQSLLISVFNEMLFSLNTDNRNDSVSNGTQVATARQQ